MKSSHPKLKLNYKIWIETDDGLNILGEGKWKLLKDIKQTGSLKNAVEKSGLAYRQTWDNLKKIEDRIGFKLIDKSRGGEKGGQTVLTAKGEKIVDFFEKLYGEIEPDIQQHFTKLIIELNKIIE
jgi:molybdate transport system regulatory protein